MKCRHCAANLTLPLIDLGMAPPSNAYLTVESLERPERRFPLRVLVCERCWLVQTEDFADAHELFDANYAYFSGVSTSWLAHAERYAGEMVARLGLDARSRVVEVAANDGYLLQYVKARGIPCTGVEPTASTAAAARAKGIDIVQDFFGRRLATQMVTRGLQADLMAANNVLAHVPDINDFVAGFVTLLKPQGVATFEFPHLLRLMADAQFDTIYHEHFSYLSLTAVQHVFEAAGLKVFDVEEFTTHGGSLRVFAQRADTGAHPVTQAVGSMLRREINAGVQTVAYYQDLQPRAERIRDDLLRFLHEAKRQGRSVVAYGAAAKGNTLLNFAGVGSDLIRCVVDLNPAKQGKFMPGSRIPIVGCDELIARRPDDLLILPWNLISEIREQHAGLAGLGTRFVVAVPRLVTA
jgi:2-polyprenyl-3-methyl-5-hydroxy-6-metoxy-1,4-benzoquinol methylase